MISQEALFDFSKFGSRVVQEANSNESPPAEGGALRWRNAGGKLYLDLWNRQKLMFPLGNALGYYRNT